MFFADDLFNVSALLPCYYQSIVIITCYIKICVFFEACEYVHFFVTCAPSPLTVIMEILVIELLY